ncbi:transcriptional regulator WhiJ [Streptomyces calidiresistens]|uniref:Helix-turn-helix domain-containing protein n=1 Tax=Streptomyces calidiresistens TaxID=1485586 RepID=A0A7W3T6P7_9ACTN|nr:helix-turn-helix transcriptional regulator [Streptomyces calidiresistens]MBB0231944.1 helix-turn-helix domain-containing protein [Streptomyces calidiresistens]
MAVRQPPTIRKRRLGAELRRLREAAGMSAPRAAELLGTDRTTISNIESGRFGLREERLRRLAAVYECDDPALIDALATVVGGRRTGWWEEYRGKIPSDFLDVSEIEHHAVRLRTVQTSLLPGLFHTEDHARALFDLVIPRLPRLEVELRVAHRMDRQRVLVGERSIPYVGVVHESALRMRFGTRDAVRQQLKHLLEMSDRDNVDLSVIPFAAGGYPLVGDSVLYAEDVHPRLDTVHVDAPLGAVFIDSPTQLANFRRRLDAVHRMALTPERSRDLILAITREL